MSQVYRTSPVHFDASAVESEERAGWTVVTEYADEKDGPWIIDLSHLPRWDLQDRDLGQYQPCGLDTPESPGISALGEKVLINRMNRTQASIWHLGPGEEQGMPKDRAYTDVGENTVCLAVIGPQSFAVSEKVTNLDLADPKRTPPCLIQGPLVHVPCQIALLSNHSEQQGFVFTCSRGYARDMVHTLLAAGKEFGLRPAGEKRMQWLWET